MAKTTLGEATFTKMVRHPTSGSIKIMTTKLEKVANTFSTMQWGETYGCLPLILDQDEMRYVAHDNHFHYVPMAKPNLVNVNITEKKTFRKLVLLQ